MPDVSLRFFRLLNGLSIAVWGAFAAFAVMLWIDRNTIFGMRLKCAGDNEEALARRLPPHGFATGHCS
jgi:simple sugar transport system permease protein